jgi:hypothetical protein
MELFTEDWRPIGFHVADIFNKVSDEGYMIDAYSSKYLVIWNHNCNTADASCLSLGCPSVKTRKHIWEKFGLTFGVKKHNCKFQRYCDSLDGCPVSTWHFSSKILKSSPQYTICKKYITKMMTAAVNMSSCAGGELVKLAANPVSANNDCPKTVIVSGDRICRE